MFKQSAILVFILFPFFIFGDSGLKISEKGIVDIKTGRIVNNMIKKGEAMTYLFFISEEKSNDYDFILEKETFLNSSQEQCRIPITKKGEDFFLGRVYCTDNLISVEKARIVPSLKIIDLINTKLSEFNPDILSSARYFSETNRTKKLIIFKNIPVVNSPTSQKLTCEMPIDDFGVGIFKSISCSKENKN